MASRWLETRRRRRAECPMCGAPRLLNARLEQYRLERYELLETLEQVSAERDRLLLLASGVRPDHIADPPLPGERRRGRLQPHH